MRLVKASVVLGAALAAWFLLVGQHPTSAAFVSVGDGGWECLKTLPSAKQWSAVHFVDGKTGWIVGNKTTILKTTDSGKNWAPQGPRLERFIYDICFTDRDHGWMVGTSMDDAHTGVILKTSDSGATWRVVLDGKSDGLRSVCFVNNDVGWAVGGGRGSGVILKTADGGETWFEQDSGIRLVEKDFRLFEGVSFVDEHTGYLLGNVNGKVDVYKTTDGGQTWTHTPQKSKGAPRGIQFVDADTGWVLTGKTIRGTTDGGRSWTEYESADTLKSFHFCDARIGITASAGKVLHTSDGGRTWSSSNVAGLQGAHPSVQMVDSANGWAVGDYGVFRTLNGGSTWQALSSGQDDFVFRAHFADQRAACAVGYSVNGSNLECIVLNTEDGWQTWKQQVLPFKGQLVGLDFADDKTGWACGLDGLIVATKDGGKTWKARHSGTKAMLYNMHFLDATTGWAIGHEGTLVATSDGGTTWSRVNIGTMDAMGDVFFLDRSTGWICGANGRIMKTTDGGVTWERQPSGTLVGLSGIFFLDADTGWCTGPTGVVLHTTDGGATWVRQETGTEKHLEPICFINRNEGWIGGHTIIHTTDGGRTWAVQDSGTLGLWGIYFLDSDNGWATGGLEVLRTTTGGLPGAVWAKKQEDGKQADFGHLVVTKKSDGYLLAEHPDSRVGIHIRTADSKPNVGDYIYVHGKVASENGEKIIAADSIEIMCAGWGMLPQK